jgi:hypothetical protein
VCVHNKEGGDGVERVLTRAVGIAGIADGGKAGGHGGGRSE